MASSSVSVERHGAVVEVELRRPERRNALTASSIAELTRIFRTLTSADVGAVLLHGGDFFSAGLDLSELADGPPPIEEWLGAHRALAAIEAPVVACLLGGAINAGAALVLAADLVVAGENSYLQIKEAEMGMVPTVNAAWLAIRHSSEVGLQLALSCQRVHGPELRRMRVATEVVADDEALTHTRQLVDRLSRYPQAGAARTKGILSAARGARESFDTALDAALKYSQRT